MNRLLKGAGVSLAATLFALLAVEGVLRIVKINTLSHITYVKGKGLINEPGAYYVHKKEGFSEGRFNVHGFRDVERSIEKPPGTYRIAVFGDSEGGGPELRSIRLRHD